MGINCAETKQLINDIFKRFFFFSRMNISTTIGTSSPQLTQARLVAQYQHLNIRDNGPITSEQKALCRTISG